MDNKSNRVQVPMNIQKFMMLMKKIEAVNYEDKFVCFVDVLGYRAQLLESQKPGDVFLPVNLMINMKNANAEYQKGLSIVLFSDCAYIVADLQNIETLLRYISILFLRFLTDNTTCKNRYKYHLLRGGLTFGKIYYDIDENFIVGPAMVTAYEMESKYAKYPRVIVDKKIKPLLEKEIRRGFIKKDRHDENGFYFIDVVGILNAMNEIKKENIKDTIKWAASLYNESSSLKDKYGWISRYLDTAYQVIPSFDN